MPASLETFPVSKNGTFIGYADARQIAASNGKLELYDESKAKSEMAAQAVANARVAAVSDEAVKTESSKAGGADPSAVKRGPRKPA